MAANGDRCRSSNAAPVATEGAEMTDERRLFRLVRIRAKPGKVDELEQLIAGGIRERLGFPGLIASHRLRSSESDDTGEVAIATIWQSREALDRYLTSSGGAALVAEVQVLVAEVSIKEWEVVSSDEYELIGAA